MKNVNILVVDDEKIIRDGCKDILKKDYYVECVETGKEAIDILSKNLFHLVILDLKLPDINGIKILEKVKSESDNTEVIIITGYATISSAVEAIKKGAFDYIPKPFTPEELRLKVQNALRNIGLKFENIYLRETISKKEEPPVIVAKSKKMQNVYQLIKKVAPTDSTILIYGETGSGKELIAREIHRQSTRADKLFFPVDCGALVETLLESELFGHIKGSFTGAINTKHGSFELANGGTFFFDEIANLSLNMQAKLLRVIQEKEIRPVGGTKSMKVDVRIISATNKDLKKAVEEGTFREDLFYRISVITISLPPLRERKEDIPLLANYFLKKFTQKRNKNIKRISPEVLDIFQRCDFPGNVRELQNIIERAVIIEDTDAIHLNSLPTYLLTPPKKEIEGESKSLKETEKEQIIRILEKNNWHKTKAAQELGINRKTLYRKIKFYGLTP